MNKLLPISVALLLAIFVCPNLALAQQPVISGVLLDEETNEPLPFASIGIKGEPYGTVSNLSGEFDFHPRGNFTGRVLSISMLGYENYERPIAQLIGEGQIVIKLKKMPKILNEVTIEDSLSGADIMDIAINRFSINYANDPYLLDGFYRDLKSVNSTYVSLLEAAINIFDHNHDEPRNPFKLREKVGLVQVRKSLGYNNRYVGYFDQGNLLENLLLNNNIRYYDFPATTLNNAYTRLGRTTFDNADVYIVESEHIGVRMKLYIDVSSYAIVRLEYESRHDENILNVNERYKEYLNRAVKFIKTIEYKQYGGKYYLHYITLYKRNQWFHKDAKTLDYDVELYQELLVNDIHPNTSKRIKPNERMRKYGLQYQDQPYDAEFWQNYNVIKRTPLDDRIIEDLEREGNLRQQFGE